jgi:hypothetical protein
VTAASAKPLNAWHLVGAAVLVLAVGLVCGGFQAFHAIREYWFTSDVVYDVRYAQQRLVFTRAASARLQQMVQIKKYKYGYRNAFLISGTAGDDTKEFAHRVLNGTATWQNPLPKKVGQSQRKPCSCAIALIKEG